MSHTEQFQAWYNAEKQKGLVDLKFYTGELKNATMETFSREALAFVLAKKKPITQNGF